MPQRTRRLKAGDLPVNDDGSAVDFRLIASNIDNVTQSHIHCGRPSERTRSDVALPCHRTDGNGSHSPAAAGPQNACSPRARSTETGHLSGGQRRSGHAAARCDPCRANLRQRHTNDGVGAAHTDREISRAERFEDSSPTTSLTAGITGRFRARYASA